MNIRTKFVFGLVTVALASMAALGIGMYQSVERELAQSRRDQLTSLAEFKQTSMDGIISGWRDRVSLVASRTQLRLSLREYNRTHDEQVARRIGGILSDAEAASPLFLRLTVGDLHGDTVAVAGAGPESRPLWVVAPSEDVLLSGEGARTFYAGVELREIGRPTVRFRSRLAVEDEVVGWLEATLDTEEVARLTQDYEGLGATGETLVVVTDPEGVVRALHALRDADPVSGAAELDVGDDDGSASDAAQDPPGPGSVMAAEGPAGRAARGEEAQLIEGLDYRGQFVWASTRFVPETGWGLVVKIDFDEQAAPINQFFWDTVWLSIKVAAFVIAIGTFFGFLVAQPILQLSEAADRFGEGDLSVRAKVIQEDEVGHLARTFNEMAEQIGDQIELLTQFRMFFDVSIDLLCIASTDGFFKVVNPAFTRELGWSEEELLSRPFGTFVHPDDVEATGAEVSKLATGALTLRFANRFQCSDGSYKHLLWNAYPEPETGRLFSIARVQLQGPSES